LVLPQSPLPQISGLSESSPQASAARFWIWPILGIVVTVALVSAVVVAVIAPWSRWRGRVTAPETSAPQLLENHRRLGQQALAEGSYQRASEQFGSALELARKVPEYNVGTAMHDQLFDEHRQTAMLADLLSESLGEIIRNSVGFNEQEWHEVFQRRYRGRSIILDDTVRRESNGKYAHELQLEVLGAGGVIALDRLELLDQLPDLRSPTRIIVGFRLDRLERDRDGRWLIIPHPKSGVLLTQSEGLTGLSLTLDADTSEVLKRQSRWWATLPRSVRHGQ
jgi:hypothetical protein